MAKFRYQHIKSSVEGKAPTAAQIKTAEIGVNDFAGDEKLFIKNSAGEVVDFPRGYSQTVIDENERVTAEALNYLNTNKLDASAYTPTDLSNYYTKDETSGKTEIQDALDEKANTATTLAGYGITDAYTKDEIDNTELAIAESLNDLNSRKLDASAYTPTDLSDYYKKSEVDARDLWVSGTGENAIVQKGGNNTASGKLSVAMGSGTTASGNYSVAEGYNTIASGYASHAEGNYAKANGYSSHAEGNMTSATTNYSHAEGNYTITLNDSEHASGQYNVSNSASTDFGDSGNTLFSVGNGTSTSARHNAFEIRQNGDIYIVSGDTNIKLQDNIGSITVDQVLDGTTSASTNPIATMAVYDAVSDLSGQSETVAAALVDLNSEHETIAYSLVDLNNRILEISGNTPSINIDQVIDSTTSASTGAVSTSAVYGFVTSYTPSITVDQVLDNTKSASTNPVSSKAVYDVIVENEEIVSAALTELNDNKLDASAYTPTDLSNYYTKSETSGATEIQNALDEKADLSDIPSVNGYADSVKYNSTSHYVEFYHGTTAGTKVFEYDASPFLIDGMVESVAITTVTSGGSEVQVLEITWNSAAGSQVTDIPLSDIFDPTNYYQKSETSGATEISNALNGKLNTSDFNAYSGAVDTVIASKASESDLNTLSGTVTAHTADTIVHVTAADKTNWNNKTSNTGTVTKISTASGLTGGDITTSGTIGLETVGTAGTYYRVVVDKYGRVTSGNTTDANTNYYTTGLTVSTATTSNTITVKGNNSAVSGSAVLSAASTTSAGLMSSTDKGYMNTLSKLTGNTSTLSAITASSTAINSLTGSVGTMAFQNTSSYSSATQVNTALAEKAIVKALTNEDLNNVKTPGFYNAGGSNTCTNKPSNYSSSFGLEVIHDAIGDYYTQIFYVTSSYTTYRRYCNNGTWSDWVEEVITDKKATQTNTTTNGTYEVLLAGSTATATTTEGATKNVGLTYNPSTSALTASKKITTLALNNIVTGTGTVGSTASTSSYTPSLWKFNKGIATPSDGDTFTIKIPVAGHNNGVYISLNNGTNYYPLATSGTGRATTHYPSGTTILVSFETSGSVAGIYPTTGAASGSTVTVTGGAFRVLNFYDANSNVTQTNTTANASYRLLFSATADDTSRTETARKNTGLQYNPSTSALTVSKKITTLALNNALIGTGTVGYSGTTQTPNYMPSKWSFNKGIATPSYGDTFTIQIPCAGFNTGVYMSLNNGTTYHPIVLNGTTRLTTHFSSGLTISVVYESGGTAASIWPVTGGTSGSSGTSAAGVFRVLNFYDSNTTYSQMSSAELSAGTATTSRVMRADYVKAGLDALYKPKTYSAATYTSSSISTPAPLVYCLVKASSNLTNQVCPVSSLADGQMCDVVYMGSTTAATYTVSVSTTYQTPDGNALTFTVPKKGYVEINYVNIKGTIFVRGSE